MSIINFMGNTPIVKLNKMSNNSGQIFVKMEEFNPGGSIKSRVGMQMIEDAEKQGKLKKGDTLLEATGGNTGIGLAISAAIKGYSLILTIPDNFSSEKIEVLKKLGANIILADHTQGNDCHIKAAEQILKNNEDYKCLNQFSNVSNPKAHYYGTGKEIVDQMQNTVHYFVASIGSGGTIMGVGKRLKECIADVKIVGVQPEGCDLKKGIYVSHKIQATAVGRMGTFMDFRLIDNIIDINYEEVQERRAYLAKTQGIFVGISSGANIVAAYKLAKQVGKEAVIVTVAPDSGRSYLDVN